VVALPSMVVCSVKALRERKWKVSGRGFDSRQLHQKCVLRSSSPTRRYGTRGYFADLQV